MQRRSFLAAMLLAPFAAMLPTRKAKELHGWEKWKTLKGHPVQTVPPPDVPHSIHRIYATEPLTEGKLPPDCVNIPLGFVPDVVIMRKKGLFAD